MASSPRPLVERLPRVIKMQPFEFFMAATIFVSGVASLFAGGLLAMTLDLTYKWMPHFMFIWDVAYTAGALLVLIALLRPALPLARALERGGLILLSTCAFVYAVSVMIYSSQVDIASYLAILQLGFGLACLVRSALLAEVDRIVLDTLKEANSRHEGDKENGSK